MTSGQKIAVSLLFSVVLFAAFSVAAFAGLFDIVETRFYQPKVKQSIEKRLAGLSAAQTTYFETLAERFDTFSKNADVRSYVSVRPEVDSVKNREQLRVDLFAETPALRGIRILDSSGITIHYSSFDLDILQKTAQSVVYKKYTDLKDLPYASIFVPAVTGEKSYSPDELPALEKCKVYRDESDNRIIFAYPFYDSIPSYRGTILFYCDPNDLSHYLQEQNLVTVSDNAKLVTKPKKEDGSYSNFGGFVFGLPTVSQGAFEAAILDHWENYADITVQKIIADENTQKILFSLDNKNPDFGFIAWIYNDSIIEFSNPIKVLLLTISFVTLFLLIFLLFSLKQDDMVVIEERIKRFQLAFITEALKRKDSDVNSLPADLAKRKESLSDEIKKSLGRRGKKHSKQVEELLEHSWDEILGILGVKPASNGGMLDSAGLRQMLEDILGSGTISVKQIQTVESADSSRTTSHTEPAPTAAPKTNTPDTTPPTAERASQPAPVAEPHPDVEAEPAEAVEELSEVEEAEPVEVAEELSNAENAEPAGAAEELSEVEDAEPVEDAEELAEIEEAEPAEVVEELSEVEEAEPAEDAEELAEVGDAEPAGVAEELSEVDEAEPAEVAEELSNAENAEPAEEAEELSEVEEAEPVEAAEELSEVEDSEPAGAAEELSEVEDADPVGAAEELAEVEESEPAEVAEELSEVEEAEPVEDAEELTEVEDAEPVEEPEELSEVEEAEPAEEAEELAEVEEAEPAEAVEELTEVENAEPVEAVEELTEVDEAEPAEAVEELTEVDEAEPVDVVEELAEVEENESVEAVEELSEVEESEPAEVAEALTEVEDADPVEAVEKLTEVEEAEPAEAAEELAEVGDAEPAEEAEAPTEVDESEPAEETEELSEVEEAEPAEVAEALTEVEEAAPAEATDELTEAEPAGVAEEHSEVESVEPVEATEELSEVEESEPAEVAGELSEVEDAEPAEAAEELSEGEESEPAEVAEALTEVEEAAPAESTDDLTEVEVAEPAEAMENAPLTALDDWTEDINELAAEEEREAEPDFGIDFTDNARVKTTDEKINSQNSISFDQNFKNNSMDLAKINELEKTTGHTEDVGDKSLVNELETLNADLSENESLEPIEEAEPAEELNDTSEENLPRLKKLMLSDSESSVDVKNYNPDDDMDLSEKIEFSSPVQNPDADKFDYKDVSENFDVVVPDFSYLDKDELIKIGQTAVATSEKSHNGELKIKADDSQGTSPELQEVAPVEELEQPEEKMPFLFTTLGSNNMKVTELRPQNGENEKSIVQNPDGTFCVSKNSGDRNIKLDNDFKTLVDSVLR